MCKLAIYNVLCVLCRILLKRRMKTSPKIDEGLHPAVNCVRNFMSGSEDCLVLWGPPESKTVLCAQAIAQGVIREDGLAKIFRCDQIARGRDSLQKFFLDSLRCDTLENFIALLPSDKPQHHIWLIFDAVNRLQQDTILFFQDLIQLGHESSRFKVLLCTHEVSIACSVLAWANRLRCIGIVEPVGCCRWKESHLEMIGSNGPTQVRAGCPGVEREVDAISLETQWAFGVARLNHFIRNERSCQDAYSAGVICLRNETL